MLDLAHELRAIVTALNRADVEYALAGGLAVSIYAAPRATLDIDLLIAIPDLDKAMTAVHDLGYRIAGRPMPVAGGRLEIQRLVKIDGSDLLPLDLLLPNDPELARTLTARSEITWEGTPLWIVTASGLRTLKRLRDSPQDRADLEALGPEAS